MNREGTKSETMDRIEPDDGMIFTIASFKLYLVAVGEITIAT